MKRMQLLAVFIAIAGFCMQVWAGGPTLHIYTALDPSEAELLISAFEADTKINVEYVRLGTGELLTRLKAEATRPQVSVWFGGSCPDFIAGKNAGVLQAYKSPAGWYLTEGLRDADWFWSGYSFGALGFACNTKFFDDNKISYPSSWDDLLKPELKGKISMAYPYTSGTAYTVLATIVQLMGEDKGMEYFKKLDANIHHYNDAGSACVTQAGLGEVAVGIAFIPDILAKGIAKGYPIKLTVPKEGTGYELTCIALVKGAPEPELGQKFIDWMLNVRAQNLLKQWFELPLNPQAEVAAGAYKRDDVKLIDYNMEWAGNNYERLNQKWRKTVGR